MADDEQIEASGEEEEIEAEGDDEGDDDEGEEFEAATELRNLERESIEQTRRLKKMANRLDDRDAIALREIAGVYQMLTDIASATAEAVEELDEAQGGEQPIESFLTDDDATALFGALHANLKLSREAAAATEGDARTVLEGLVELNEGMLARIVEMSELDEEELRQTLEKSALQ